MQNSNPEDETFNALRRIPFAEMRTKVARVRAEQMLYRVQVDFASIFRNSGWTYEEYEQAREESVKVYKAHLYDSGESYKIVHASPYPDPADN